MIFKPLIICRFILLTTAAITLAVAQGTQRFPIFKDGKVGFIDRQGKIMIKPTAFELQQDHYFIPEVSEGLFAVKMGENIGYIDTLGNVVIKPRFSGWAGAFRNGFAIAGVKTEESGMEPYHAVIDRKGKFIIPPKKPSLEWIDNFLFQVTWNYDPVQFYDYALLMPNGELITSASEYNLEFDGIDQRKQNLISAYFTFHEGLLPVELNKKFGFKDRNNQFVIAATYDRVGHFSEGLAAAELKGRWGFIDKTGGWAIPAQFDTIHVPGFDKGHCFVRLNGKWGWIDRLGKFIVPPSFEDVKQERMREGLIGIRLNGKWGFMDSTGRTAIQPQFMDVGHFSEGYGIYNAERPAYFNDRIGYGYIDRSGKVLLKATSVFAGDFQNGWAYMVYTASAGRDPFPVDRKFREILPDAEIQGQNDSLWVLGDYNNHTGYGLYHIASRRYIVPPTYAFMTFAGYDLVFVVFERTETDYEYGYLDFSGNIIFRARDKGKPIPGGW